MSKLFSRTLVGAAVSLVTLPIQATAPGPEVLWDQRGGDSGTAIVSQNFEASFDQYDCQGADDFIVPEGETWVVQMIETIGTHFNGTGPLRSMRVTFHRNSANRPGRPGEVLADFAEARVDDVTCEGCGSYFVYLPEPVRLKPGKHWLALQGNIDFAVGGEWAWESSRTGRGRPAVWRNPGDGFQTGCVDYQRQLHCIGDLGQGPDFMFALHGKRKARD